LQVEAFWRARARFAVFILLSGAVLAGIAGCRGTPNADVVATVNGKDILRSDLEKYYRNSLGSNPQPLSPEESGMRRLSMLRELIDDEITQQRAAKLNLVASDEDVNARLTEMKAGYTQEEFDKYLKDKGITLDDFKRDIRRALTATKLLNKEIDSKINITDAEIASYYEAHKTTDFDYIEPRYNLARIVVTNMPAQRAANMPHDKATTDAEARKKIQSLHSRLDAGEDFGALAASDSEDPNTSSNDGDLGFVVESQLREDPEVFAAISKLKPGQYTDVLPIYEGAGPAHHIAGYAIVKLISREPAGQRGLNDPNVQQWIRQQLRSAHAQLLRTAYLEVARDEAKVRNYYAEQILKEGAK
jgi:peptidyl-prolyl cis-trans isomerase SurA